AGGPQGYSDRNRTAVHLHRRRRRTATDSCRHSRRRQPFALAARAVLAVLAGPDPAGRSGPAAPAPADRSGPVAPAALAAPVGLVGLDGSAAAPDPAGLAAPVGPAAPAYPGLAAGSVACAG